MSVKVSIVVPVYNGDKYLDNCIKNLQSQTYDNLEFVLVDDGSTDNTPQKCDQYAAGDSRIRVVHQANGGLSAARNAGTRAATGDYIVYYDVDDDINEKLVADNVELALKHDADVVMYSFWYHDVDQNKRKENKYDKSFAGTGEEFFHNVLCETISFEIFNAPWNKLYKASFLKDNNLEFLPEYPIYEDVIFASKMLQFAQKIVINPDRYYVYYVRSSGSLITKYVDGYFDSVTKFYDNALDYCRMYEGNEAQIRKFSGLYVRLVTTNLKQISSKKEVPLKRKIELIEAICKNENFRSALAIADLEKKKTFVKFFTLNNMPHAIYIMYNFLTWLG